MFETNGPTSKLTQQETTECLKQAFAKLSPEDQANIERAMEPLLEIPRMGPVSALKLIFALDRAPELERLNVAVLEQAKKREGG